MIVPQIFVLSLKSWLNNHILKVDISLGAGLYWEGHSQCDCDADWWTLDKPFFLHFPYISSHLSFFCFMLKILSVCIYWGRLSTYICWQTVLHSSQFPQISTLLLSFSFLFFQFRILSRCLYWGRLITFAMGDCKELIGGASFPHFLSICYIYQVMAKGGPTHITPLSLINHLNKNTFIWIREERCERIFWSFLCLFSISTKMWMFWTWYKLDFCKECRLKREGHISIFCCFILRK